MDVGFRAVFDGTTTKHLAPGLQLDMNFQPDRCYVITLHAWRPEPLFLQSAVKSRKEQGREGQGKGTEG